MKLFKYIADEFFVIESDDQADKSLIMQAISALEKEWEVAELSATLAESIVVKSLVSKLEEENSSRAFKNRGITFCTMLPMRSIPAKVICVLGMNEGEFPRFDRRKGFDLMSYQWRMGDRTARLDDRYIFLESLLSARQNFYCSYLGQDQKDNAEVPPSIILAELIDFFKKAYQNEKYAPTEHALQAYSSRYFNGELATYSEQNEKAFEALYSDSKSDRKFCETLLPLPDKLVEKDGAIEVQLDDLVNFFKNPVKAFLKAQFNTTLWEESEEELSENEAFDKPDALEQWSYRQEIFEVMRRNPEWTEEQLTQRFLAEGKLPFGEAGEAVFESLLGETQSFRERLEEQELGDEEHVPIDLRIDLAQQKIRLVGKVRRVYTNRYIPYSFSKLGDKYLLREVIPYLALTLSKMNEGSVDMCFVALDKNKDVGSIHPADAEAELKNLVTYYIEGLQEALPFFPDVFKDFIFALKKSEEEAEATLQKLWSTETKLKDFSKAALKDDDCNRTCFGTAYPEACYSLFEQINQIYQKVIEGGN